MLKAVLLAAALVGVQSNAYAAEFRSTPVEIAVSTAGVNFDRPSDVRKLHFKLERAAARACDSSEGRMMSVIFSDERCAKTALNRAIAEINQPLLTAYHRGEPITVANTKVAQR